MFVVIASLKKLNYLWMSVIMSDACVWMSVPVTYACVWKQLAIVIVSMDPHTSRVDGFILYTV